MTGDRSRALWLIPLLLAPPLLGCEREREAPEVQLRLHYDVGDTLHYEYRVEGTVTRPDSVAGTEPLTEPYERWMRIDEVATDLTARGNYLLAWTYHLPPDTAAAARPPEALTVHVEITPQGRVMDVGGIETARRLFGDLDFQTYLEQTQPVFPERPLKAGDSWTQEVRVLSPRGETVVTESTYVLERIVQEEGVPVAVIGFDGDVYLPVIYGSAEGGAPAPSAEERIRARGRIVFAHERGVTLRVETTARATLTRISMEGEEPSRREIQFSQQSVLRIVEE